MILCNKTHIAFGSNFNQTLSILSWKMPHLSQYLSFPIQRLLNSSFFYLSLFISLFTACSLELVSNQRCKWCRHQVQFPASTEADSEQSVWKATGRETESSTQHIGMLHYRLVSHVISLHQRYNLSVNYKLLVPVNITATNDSNAG